MGFADYCLHGSTMVKTKEFGYVPIEKIVENELNVTVYSYKEGKVVTQEISQYWTKPMKLCSKYVLSNNKEIICTDDHKFLTTSGMETINNIYKNNLDLIEG